METNIITDLPVLARDEARDIDKAVTEKLGRVRVLESVATRIADTIAYHLGLAIDTPLLFVVGKGNNGANGMAAARILFLRGWKQVKVVPLVYPTDQNSVNIAEQFELFHTFVGKDQVHPLDYQRIQDFEGVLIDGMLGTGIASAPRGASLQAIMACNASKARILAIDMPSGINHVSGEAPGEAIKATWTINLHMLKSGQLAQESKQYIGELYSAETALGFHTFPGLEKKILEFYKDGPIRKVPY